MSLGDVALAPAVDRGVDRDAEGRVMVRNRARDVIVDPGLIAAHVKLEDAKAVGRFFRNPLEARLAHRAQNMGDPERTRRPRNRSGGARMKALQGANWRQHYRQSQSAGEGGDAGIDV